MPFGTVYRNVMHEGAMKKFLSLILGFIPLSVLADPCEKSWIEPGIAKIKYQALKNQTIGVTIELPATYEALKLQSVQVAFGINKITDCGPCGNPAQFIANLALEQSGENRMSAYLRVSANHGPLGFDGKYTGSCTKTINVELNHQEVHNKSSKQDAAVTGAHSEALYGHEM
jgi:hypothetical protein